VSRGRRWRRRDNRPDWDKHLSGFRAPRDWADCPRCGLLIQAGQNAVKRDDAWIHVHCAPGWEDGE
jgi:hypothetical protein